MDVYVTGGRKGSSLLPRAHGAQGRRPGGRSEANKRGGGGEEHGKYFDERPEQQEPRRTAIQHQETGESWGCETLLRSAINPRPWQRLSYPVCARAFRKRGGRGLVRSLVVSASSTSPVPRGVRTLTSPTSRRGWRGRRSTPHYEG